MRTVLVRLHGELEDLAPGRHRGRVIERRLDEGATLKHALEALDVPHTEIGEVSLDGAPSTLAAVLSDGARVDAWPAPPEPPDAAVDARFIADAHLGALAKRLRLLGFDTLLASDGSDSALAALAQSEGRILLSRDRELLKHRRVARGRLVRALDADEQLVEVAQRFGLRHAIRPFSRCLECNAPLRGAERGEVDAIVPPRVAGSQSGFTVCTGCARVYWPGSHWRRLRERVEALCAAIDAPDAPAPDAPTL